MRFSVKMIIRHTVETGEVFLEESIIMLEASSFDDAYAKAESYAEENEICCSYDNMFGKRVHSEVVSFSDCFSVYDDEEVTEVYSSVMKCKNKPHEEALMAYLDYSPTRKELLPLRQWRDPEHPEELDAE